MNETTWTITAATETAGTIARTLTDGAIVARLMVNRVGAVTRVSVVFSCARSESHAVASAFRLAAACHDWLGDVEVGNVEESDLEILHVNGHQVVLGGDDASILACTFFGIDPL